MLNELYTFAEPVQVVPFSNLKWGKFTLLHTSPKGSNGQHATSLYFSGNPTREEVIKAGMQIRIPKNTCEEIIDTVQTICQQKLPVSVILK